MLIRHSMQQALWHEPAADGRCPGRQSSGAMMLVLGVFLALVGAAGFAAMNTAIRHGVRPGDPEDGLFTTVTVNVLVFTALVAALTVTGRLGPMNPAGVAVFITAGFCATFLGRGLLFGSISRIGAVRGSAIKNATPLVTVVIALVFLGERLSVGATLGVVTVLAGVFLLVRETLRLAGNQARRRDRDIPLEAGAEIEASGVGALKDTSEPAAQGRTRAMRDSAARWRAARDMTLVLGVVLALLSTLVLATGHALRKVGMDIMPDALLAATIGSWTAFGAFLGAAAARRRVRAGFKTVFVYPRRSFWVAGLMSCVGQLAMFGALDVAPVSVVSVVGGSEAILTVLFAAVVLGRAELISRWIVVPAILVFFGSAIIALAG
jgi:drug/metabolite transporter (DMT)-like permease